MASSERLALADLAGILNVAVEELQVAMSVACRLGFATRLAPSAGDAPGGGPAPAAATTAAAAALSHGASAAAAGARLPGQHGAAAASAGALMIPDDDDASAAASEPLGPAGGSGALASAGAAVAIVVDSEATSYLMMGALSPGLKRHSVSLFEGGRVSGAEVMAEMVRELWASYEAGQGFEGDMLRLTNYTAALATLLEAAGGGAGAPPLELVRKESLSGEWVGAAW